MGCHALLQGILLIQALNLGLLHCRQILYCLSPQGSYPNTRAPPQGHYTVGPFPRPSSIQHTPKHLVMLEHPPSGALPVVLLDQDGPEDVLKGRLLPLGGRLHEGVQGRQ